MMAALPMMITNAGIDAIVDAQNGGTDMVTISEIGLTATPFILAPTIDALPGEFKRLETVSGQAVSENVIHVTAYDADPVTYDVTGFGLYASDGTLIAIYSAAADPVLTKAALATSLFALDIAFAGSMAAVIEFGDALFLNPPASETVQGVARIATQARVNAADDGDDDAQTIVTPKTLRARLAAFLATVTAALDAFGATVNAISGRTITGSGLASGGGDLSANRVINVAVASGAEAQAGTANNKALTPASLWAFPGAQGGTNVWQVPGTKYVIQYVAGSLPANTRVTITLPQAFATACVFASLEGGRSDFASQDNPPFVESWTASTVTIFNAIDTGSTPYVLRAEGY
jgi:hypothetical protein